MTTINIQRILFLKLKLQSYECKDLKDHLIKYT